MATVATARSQETRTVGAGNDDKRSATANVSEPTSRWLTLEVRPSNDVAVRLYEKFGFKVIGRRRGYYTDNNEDAIVMWSDSIQAPSFKKRFKEILETLEIDGIDSSQPI